MQKTVIPSLTRNMDTDGHSGYSGFALRDVSRKLTIRGGVSITHASCLPCQCHLDLIDTMFKPLYAALSFIRLSIADGRRWETGTGHFRLPVDSYPFTYL